MSKTAQRVDMIITVTPNPLLDFSLPCKEHPAQGGHRRDRIGYTVGGKGINVARMLKSLGPSPECFEFTPPRVREISAVGSGDATLAGMIFARVQGLSMIDAVKWEMAAGAADAAHAAPCSAAYEEIEVLFQKVKPPVKLT